MALLAHNEGTLDLEAEAESAQKGSSALDKLLKKAEAFLKSAMQRNLCCTFCNSGNFKESVEIVLQQYDFSDSEDSTNITKRNANVSTNV